MAETIDTIVKQDIKSPLDISKMCDRFKTSNDIFSFDSPFLETIEKNIYFLLRHSTTQTFESKYKYRPDYLSYDAYGTVVLAQLLMYVNSVQTIEDFNLQEVIVPSKDSVIQILKDNFPEKDPDDLSEVVW